ncbi:MAG: N-acetylmuramoyl-L-alanine amidase, partial [Rectinema sp.]|nr:N-acetylmuramoyl-L-alanine amidase [Rectinema sp.]
MKVAIASSLQGKPEESSPETPLDCYRLSAYIAEKIQALFPQVDVELWNRNDFPGKGDAYIEMREAIAAWGANVAVHIHQDAGGAPGARGWHVIYYHQEAIPLVNSLLWSMRSIPSPERYGGAVKRTDVAAVKKPKISVLIEAGFYTSVEDEAIGVMGWGNPIVNGIARYLIDQWSIKPAEREVDKRVVDFVVQELREKGQKGPFEGLEVAVATALGKGTDYLHLRINAPDTRKVQVFINVYFPRSRDLKPITLDCDSWRGRVVQLKDLGIGPDEYA